MPGRPPNSGAILALLAEPNALYIGDNQVRVLNDGANGYSTLGSFGSFSQVTCLARFGVLLLAGGNLPEIGGNPEHNLAWWDGGGWQAFQGGTDGNDTSGVVDGMVVCNNQLFIYGGFNRAGSTPCSGAAVWTGTTWRDLGGAWNVRDMIVFAGSVYAIGRFPTIPSGDSLDQVAHWNGAAWEAIGDTGFAPRKLCTYQGRLHAIGLFPFQNGSQWLAEYDGSQWQPVTLASGLISGPFEVHEIAEYLGDLVICGNFNGVGTTPANRIARWDGSTWHALGDGLIGLPEALCVRGDSLYAGIASTGSNTYVHRWVGDAKAADLDDGSGTGAPDGGVDINDLLFFLAAFETGSQGANLDDDGDPAAGNPDSGVDINDLLYFLARFAAGC